jgi:hypothetical protein
MKLSRSIGSFLLGVWLVLNGLSHLIHFGFPGMGMVMAVLAIGAGVLIILGV